MTIQMNPMDYWKRYTNMYVRMVLYQKNWGKVLPIIFGTPTWWHHVAMPLQTWIKAHPMQGKTIATYNTDGGGGTMHTSEDFEALLKGNKLLPHFTIFGTTDDKTPAVSKWLKVLGICL